MKRMKSTFEISVGLVLATSGVALIVWLFWPIQKAKPQTYGQVQRGFQQDTTTPNIGIFDGLQTIPIFALNTVNHTFSFPTLPVTNLTVSGTASVGGAFTANNIVSTEFPGLATNVELTGVPGLDNPGCVGITTCQFIIFASPTTATADNSSTVRIQRDASAVTGGPSGGFTKGAFWVLGVSGKTANEFNWNLKSELHNKTLASTGAQNVAIGTTTFKEIPPGGGEVSPSWGIDSVCSDNQGIANPVASCIGGEFDTTVQVGAGTDINKQRVGVQISPGVFPGNDPTVHVGRGLFILPQGGAIVDNAIEIQDATTSVKFVVTGSGNVSAVGGISGGQFASNGGSPVLSGCGTGAIFSVTSNGVHGTVTEGTSANGCTLTFPGSFANPPDCVISFQTQFPAVLTYSTTTTSLIVVNTSGSSQKFSYVCMGL